MPVPARLRAAGGVALAVAVLALSVGSGPVQAGSARDDLSRADPERQVGHGADGAVRLGEALDLDHVSALRRW